jgi:hypothetical protein
MNPLKLLRAQNCIRVLQILVATILLSCDKEDNRHLAYDLNDTVFEPQQSVFKVMDQRVLEISGLEASLRYPGHYWVHNDSGDEARLFLLSPTGEVKAQVYLGGIEAIDWEEITMTPDTCLIIGDIGDNRAERSSIALYKVKEPKINGLDSLLISDTEIEKMEISYHEGPRDAETLFYDFNSDSLIMITKREKKVMVYQFPFKNGMKTTIKSRGKLPFRLVTAGDMNSEGEIAIKNYDHIFFFDARQNTVENILKGPDFRIPYTPEPQGEALAWSQNANDLLLITEKSQYADLNLLKLKRK